MHKGEDVIRGADEQEAREYEERCVDPDWGTSEFGRQFDGLRTLQGYTTDCEDPYSIVCKETSDPEQKERIRERIVQDRMDDEMARAMSVVQGFGTELPTAPLTYDMDGVPTECREGLPDWSERRLEGVQELFEDKAKDVLGVSREPDEQRTWIYPEWMERYD